MTKARKAAEKKETLQEQPSVLGGQPCPICHKKTLTLTEAEKEVPYFGKMYLFSMSCSECGYHKADVESSEKQEPAKWTIEISGEKDMGIRVVKSSTATIKIPFVTTIESGPASNGYVTNIEGILNRVKKIVEDIRDNAEDKSDRKKAKNILKKLQKAMWGSEKLKIIIEDPEGNSAIISEKAAKSKLKA
ncbi:ZPR1 zinc finger domain-containing protein [Candidatus Woesearchaeota archaeon]|nr:ZPR1 zinc finger domain-containing protein [Candidatus Woesearchaeota archaeon]